MGNQKKKKEMYILKKLLLFNFSVFAKMWRILLDIQNYLYDAALIFKTQQKYNFVT